MKSRTRKPDTLGIGSVSTGTLRTEDLLDSFLWECEHLRLTREERATVRKVRKLQKTEENYAASEDADFRVNETLLDILDAHTPEYCYFGAHQGDGADFGCWPAIDSLQEDVRAGEVVRLEDVPANYTGLAMDVSDHGNVTLLRYSRGRSREVWACV